MPFVRSSSNDDSEATIEAFLNGLSQDRITRMKIENKEEIVMK
jgi:hypothetical protein